MAKSITEKILEEYRVRLKLDDIVSIEKNMMEEISNVDFRKMVLFELRATKSTRRCDEEWRLLRDLGIIVEMKSNQHPKGKKYFLKTYEVGKILELENLAPEEDNAPPYKVKPIKQEAEECAAP